jgi:uncharacterized Fe-S center protein
MKTRGKLLSVLAALVLVLGVGFAALATANSAAESATPNSATGNAARESAPDSGANAGDTSATAISFRIDSPVFSVNGREQAIDENGTVPVIQDNRTLLPVRAVAEAMGGTVEWDGATATATLTCENNVIRLVIGSTTAYLNDSPRTLDTTPVIINDRTMLPIRFIAESFGFEVGWDGASRTVTITSEGASAETSGGTPTETAEWLNGYLSEKSSGTTPENAPVVYFTSDISPQGLMAAYEALGKTPTGNVAVKVHTGESEASNHLRPDFIKELVALVDGTFVESNTAYGGNRASTAMHRQLAIDHGFTAVADVDIMDAEGSVSLPVVGGTHLTENFVGKNFLEYDSFLVLSHFKGHAMGGFGGALKNISIGIASSEGKSWIHSAGTSKTNPWGGAQDPFLESMAEAAKSVSDSLGNGERIMYINVMNRLSVDCDCNGRPAEPDMHDIGILASFDPVALDKACVDLIYAAPDSQSMVERIESRNGVRTIEHAEAIGLGSQTYELVDIDA